MRSHLELFTIFYTSTDREKTHFQLFITEMERESHRINNPPAEPTASTASHLTCLPPQTCLPMESEISLNLVSCNRGNLKLFPLNQFFNHQPMHRPPQPPNIPRRDCLHLEQRESPSNSLPPLPARSLSSCSLTLS